MAEIIAKRNPKRCVLPASVRDASGVAAAG